MWELRWVSYTWVEQSQKGHVNAKRRTIKRREAIDDAHSRSEFSVRTEIKGDRPKRLRIRLAFSFVGCLGVVKQHQGSSSDAPENDRWLNSICHFFFLYIISNLLKIIFLVDLIIPTLIKHFLTITSIREIREWIELRAKIFSKLLSLSLFF